MTRVIDHIKGAKSPIFSFEILPPLRGNGMATIMKNVEVLREFDPKYINITTHRSEYEYKTTKEGLYEKVAIRKRPGTIAVAAAVKSTFDISVVPHMLCSGFTKDETEYALMDLSYLGIYDLLLLRGDKGKHEASFIPEENGHAHATELQDQVNDWNEGKLLDGASMKIGQPFSYSVAGYPEKHEEAPNMASDIIRLKQKVDNGAEYVITQMFFDNQKYYDFVKLCRESGINVPIVPGIKPITLQNQLTVLPKIFSTELPEELVSALTKCKSNEEATQVGAEWCTMQAKDLAANGVPNIHLYSMMSTKSCAAVAKAVF
jgi:methylenetetrahydrofolate reductase (NADPH)